MNCESLLESLDGPDREAVRRHLEGCADCRALVAALEAPPDPGLADAILARTTGGACDRARSQLCDRIDGSLSRFDAELVDGHLRHCSECGEIARALRGLQDDLPRLAEIDPGAGFLESVLARTSRRPRRVPIGERCVAAVSRLLHRPRVALEGAFVAAALVGVLFTFVETPLARVPAAVNEIEATVRIGARSTWASAEVFVVDNSVAVVSEISRRSTDTLEAIRMRRGTISSSGASWEKGGTRPPRRSDDERE